MRASRCETREEERKTVERTGARYAKENSETRKYTRRANAGEGRIRSSRELEESVEPATSRGGVDDKVMTRGKEGRGSGEQQREPRG